MNKCAPWMGCQTAVKQSEKKMHVEKTTKTIEVPTFLGKAKGAGTFLVIVGGILVSISTILSSSPWVFTTFLAGHSIWLWAGYEESDMALMTMNAGMLIMDVIAILTRI